MLVGRGDIASLLLDLRIGKDDPRGGFESFSKKDNNSYSIRTRRRGRDIATYLLSNYNESPTSDNPDISIYPIRNLREKRNITST